MKKILIFTDYFLPGYKGGGPITSISNLVSLLNQYFDILICTRDKDFGNTESYKNIQSNEVATYQEFNVIYLSDFNKQTMTKTIEEFNPDVIYLNSFFSKTTQIVTLLNKFIFKKNLIVAPRGELQENALNIKKIKKSVYLFLYKLLNIYKNLYFIHVITMFLKILGYKTEKVN